MVYFNVLVELRSTAMLLRAMRQQLLLFCLFVLFFFVVAYYIPLLQCVFIFWDSGNKNWPLKTADFKSHRALSTWMVGLMDAATLERCINGYISPWKILLLNKKRESFHYQALDYAENAASVKGNISRIYRSYSTVLNTHQLTSI